MVNGVTGAIQATPSSLTASGTGFTVTFGRGATPTPPTTLIGTTTTLEGQVNPTSPSIPPTVTFTVVINPESGVVAPGGTVDLLVDGQVLGSATVQVVDGVAEATFTVEFFGSGNFVFSAEYLGSSQFQGSTSNDVTVNVL